MCERSKSQSGLLSLPVRIEICDKFVFQLKHVEATGTDQPDLIVVAEWISTQTALVCFFADRALMILSFDRQNVIFRRTSAVLWDARGSAGFQTRIHAANDAYDLASCQCAAWASDALKTRLNTVCHLPSGF